MNNQFNNTNAPSQNASPKITATSTTNPSLFGVSGNYNAFGVPSYASPFPQNVRVGSSNPNMPPQPSGPYLSSGFVYQPLPPNAIPFYMPTPPPVFPYSFNTMPNPMPVPSNNRVNSNSPADLKAIEDYIVSLLNQSKISDPEENRSISNSMLNPTVQQVNDSVATKTISKEEKVEIPSGQNVISNLNTASSPGQNSVNSAPQLNENQESNKKKNGKSSKRDKHKDKPQNFDELTTNIMELFNSLKPSSTDISTRVKLLSKLQKLVTTEWPDANPNLHLFGSSANEFGFNNADIDISLIIDESKSGQERNVVQTLGELLKKKQMRNVKTLPRARVPIVKFSDPTSNISCDICINNLLALQNTQLLADYSRIDPRVQPLGIVIKYWAKRRQINEPYQGTLSSYAYILMVLNFLQQRKPPIIPCLQQYHDPDDPLPLQRVELDGFDCYYYKKIDRLKDFGKENKETLGELLFGFFKWISCEFDWDNMVLSVRTGKFLTKVEKHWDKKVEDSRDHVYLTIEDPFEISHNLGRIVDLENIKVLKYEFDRAFRLLSRNETLKTVFKRFTPNEEKM